jgi:hypothetical protein
VSPTARFVVVRPARCLSLAEPRAILDLDAAPSRGLLLSSFPGNMIVILDKLRDLGVGF